MPDGIRAALVISATLFALIHQPTSEITVEALSGRTLGVITLGGIWLAGAPLLVAALFHLAHNDSNVLSVRPVAGCGLATCKGRAPQRVLSGTRSTAWS